MRKILSKATGRKAPSFVYVSGKESFFRRRFMRAVRDHYRSREYEIEVLDASVVKGRDVVETLDSTSLFARKKLVIIQNAEKLKGKQKALMEYLQDPAEDVVAAFEANPPKSAEKPTTPFCKALEEAAVTYIAKPLNGNKGEVEKWLQKEAGDKGYTLPQGFARAIYNATGDDLFALHNVLGKVLIHADDTVVEKADLVAVVTRTATNDTFDLTNAYNRRDLKACLHLVGAYYHQDDNPSLLIVSTLLNHLDKLIRAKSLLAYGLDPKDAASVLGMHPWVFQNKLYPHLRDFDLDKLIGSYGDMCKVDMLVKGSNLEPRVLIEGFLVRSLS